MSAALEFLQNFFGYIWTWVLPSALKIFLIVAIAFFVKHSLNLATDNFLKKARNAKRGETLRQIIYSTSRILVVIVTAMLILHEVGIDIRPIIASAGLLSLAISLGAQHVVKDVVNGFYILLEDQFGVGDNIKVGEISGIVEKMNLRTTTLKDEKGNVHIVPNNQIDKVSILK